MGGGGIWGDTAPSLPQPQGHSQPSATIKEDPLHTCSEQGVALLPLFTFKRRHFKLRAGPGLCQGPTGAGGCCPGPPPCARCPEVGGRTWAHLSGCLGVPRCACTWVVQQVGNAGVGTSFRVFGGIQVSCSIPMESVGDMDVGTYLGMFGGPQVHWSIPVEGIWAVEQMDEGTSQHPHVLQVLAQDDNGQLHTTYSSGVTPQTSVTPNHSTLGPPSSAPRHRHPHGTMGMVPNPALPHTCCTGSTGSTEVKGLTGYTGEVEVFYPGCTGVTGVPFRC